MPQQNYERLYFTLLEFLLTSKHQIMTIGAEFDLTPMQVMTLMISDDSVSRPMRSYCTAFNCDASNITGIVDGLEQKGLVSRQSDPNDRRIKVVRLESAGRAIRSKIIAEATQTDALMFNALSDDEIRQLTAILKRMGVRFPAQNMFTGQCPADTPATPAD